MTKLSDELNYGYISHNSLVYSFYRIVDFCGYHLFRPKPISSKVRSLLFINLGLIGDLIIFRYVINDFLLLDYQVSILIRDEYKFLFSDLKNIKILTLRDYQEKKILSGLYKIVARLRGERQKYDVSLHFRGYLGTGILSTYIAGVAKYQIGYTTSGFGFLLNHKLKWEIGVHESVHLLNLLQLIYPKYNTINLNCYINYLAATPILQDKYNLSDKKYILFHATSQNPAKNIPQHILKYTVNYLLTHTTESIVFVGVANEESYIRQSLQCISNQYMYRFKFIFNESFFNVYSQIAGAKLFIGVDSSLAHMSSSLDIPKIIFWHRLNLQSQWQPLGNNFYILNNESAIDIREDIIVQAINWRNL